MRNPFLTDHVSLFNYFSDRFLVLDIFQSTTKIPIFLELRRINESETLIHKLSADIDENLEYINEELLEMLLDQGGYVIILDGYDELSESARQYIGTQITELAVKHEQNSILLTSRPEVNLPEIPRSVCFNIQRLTKEQAQSLVLRYDSVCNLSVGKDLIREFDTVISEFLMTPLLVILLYLTYGYNHSIATKITVFYDDVFSALYKGHDLSKSSFARPKTSQLDSVDFRRLLRGFAFLLTAQQKSSLKSRAEAYEVIEKAIALTSIKPFSASAFLDDLLLAVPLMVKDGNEIRFIHKSIGDFFSGEYLAFAPDSEGLIRGIQDSSLSLAFTKAIDFLVDLNPSLFRTSIVAPIAKKFLEQKLIANPLIRTICFVGNFELGVFAEIPKDITRLISDKQLSSLSVEITDGSSCLVVHSTDRVRIPVGAWNLLTKPLKSNLKFKSQRLSERKLLSLFTIDKLYPINSQLFRKNSDNPEIKAVLLRLIHTISRYEGDGRNTELRILDPSLCKEMLATIETEKKSQDWINSLIKNG